MFSVSAVGHDGSTANKLGHFAHSHAIIRIMDESTRDQIERTRRKMPDERVREGFRLFEQGRDYIVRSLEQTFPEMPLEELQRIRNRVIRQCKRWEIL